MKPYFDLLAAYNAWANERIYEAASRLPDDEYRADRGVFFKSLHGTLNHLLVADRIWLRRFTGTGEAPNRLDATLFDGFDDLRGARRAEDRRILVYVDGLQAEDLSGLILSGPLIGGTAPAAQRLVIKLLSVIAPKLGIVDLPPGAMSRDPQVVDDYLNDILVTIGKVPARTAHELFAPLPGYLKRAPEMKVPVLIQHGEADALVPLAGARPTIEAIGASDKTVITYPGLFHEIYNEPEKDAVIADLSRWLEAHPA